MGPSQTQTQTLKHIAVDYTPGNCTHSPESDSIAIVYDSRGGAPPIQRHNPVP